MIQTPLRPSPAGAVSARAALPVDGTSLAVVRVVYGLVGVLVAVRTVANGWVEHLYAGPTHHFTYPGVRWVAAPGIAGTYLLLAVLALAGVGVALGWRYRAATAVFLAAFVWLELIEVTTYLNHYWFVTLFGLLLFALPGANCWSLDARRLRRTTATVPLGAIWLVRAQVAVVYVFAGVAKLNTDWLVHGLPLRLWLPARSDLAIIGPWLDEPWVAVGASWAGAAFDCLVIPALCWKRTRPFAWCALVVFHVATWRLFPIGVFPWVMIAASTVFFEPDWPRRLLARLGWSRRRSGAGGRARPSSRPLARLAVVAGVLWVVVQVLVPMRHLVIPGDSRWTNEGYRFAWAVLLTEKGGDVTFRVTDREAGTTWTETGHALYTPSQWRMMATEPELIRQAAHAIAARHAANGRRVEVRADAFVSLNARPAARLVRADVDLAREPWRVHQSWVLPAPGAAPLPGR